MENLVDLSIDRSIDRKKSQNIDCSDWLRRDILPMQSGFRIPCGGVFIGIYVSNVRTKIFFKMGCVDQIFDVFTKLR